MTNHNGEVKTFFESYEQANSAFDVEQIAAHYADAFLFGGPGGAQCVKKEDFVRILPRRKEFFRSRGLVSSKVDSLEAFPMDVTYTFVKVVWLMRLEGGETAPALRRNAATYILSKSGTRLQIILQIDHQDLAATL